MGVPNLLHTADVLWKKRRQSGALVHIYLDVSGSMDGVVGSLYAATLDCEEFLQEAGEAARNCYLPGRYVPSGESETGRLFLLNFVNKYKKSPTAMAALGYDSLRVFLEAYKAAQGQPSEPLGNALHSTTNFEGATGPITVDPVLAVSKALPILKVKDGEFAFVESLEP
mgnify:CR=1 FL=1